MKRFVSVCMALACIALAATASLADDQAATQQFATLPEGVRFPEGITADPATGEIYVGTFDNGPNANKLLRYARTGRLLAQRDFGGTPLLGLAFDAAGKKVYIANFGASKIQRIAASFNGGTAIEDVATLPQLGAPKPRITPNPDGSTDMITFGSNSFPAPNALVFDSKGALYISDSFQGAILRVDNAAACTGACRAMAVVQDPLLATAGFPPFGANGLALSRDETTLFIANTGDDRILKLDLRTGAVTVFAESINGADGVALDDGGRLWVAANQADEIVALNENGRVVARVGEFGGVRRDGSAIGLIFPASIVLMGDSIFVTNLALPLTPAVGDEPEEDVTRYTISRIKVEAK